MAPTGEWVFFATGVDSVARENCGFRYRLDSGLTTHSHLGCRTDDFFPLDDPEAGLNVGGIADPNYPPEDLVYFSQSAYAILQYVRLFLDYTPTTKDEFLNIALMESASEQIQSAREVNV